MPICDYPPGKKHAANDIPMVDIAFENESKEEIVTKIAEELQLDINKDSDLALDIMDSLTVTKDKSQDNVIEKISKKKRTTTNSTKTKKKSDKKDKVNKEQKRNRRDTFDIIEPNFVASSKSEEKPSEVIQKEEEEEELEVMVEEKSMPHAKPIELESNKGTIIETEQTLVFDPNVFATPCNLQLDSAQRTSAVQPNNTIRLRAGKSPRNLINQFDIYHPNYESIENQQLKQDEEMVIKILQQLNKSIDGTSQKDEPTTVMNIIEEIAQTEAHIHLIDDRENDDTRENSARFAHL